MKSLITKPNALLTAKMTHLNAKQIALQPLKLIALIGRNVTATILDSILTQVAKANFKINHNGASAPERTP